MLATKRGFYLVLVLVFLIKTLTGCSRFHSPSNHSPATAESSFDDNSLSKGHSRVARSNKQTNVHTSLKDTLTNRSLTADKVYRAKASSTRKYVVVFDIDECLCSKIYYAFGGTERVEKAMRQFPECPVIRFEFEAYGYWALHPKTEVWAHNFVPYLQILFEYLLDQGVRIVFFSAGIKKRNDEVIPELLKLYWGSEKYETFRSGGQFITFSADDMIQGQDYHLKDEHWGYDLKDLRRTIRDGETLSDSILVEDTYNHVPQDQKPFILVKNCLPFGDGLNNIYYMLGLFMTYFENVEYRELPLREGVGKIFSEHQVKDERYFDDLKKYPFTIRMISYGVSEVQKVVPKARLYSETDKLDWSAF